MQALLGYQFSKSIVKSHFWNNMGNLNVNWVLDDAKELVLIVVGGDDGIVVMQENVLIFKRCMLKHICEK